MELIAVAQNGDKVAGACEFDNELPASMKFWEFLH